jgi:hypothetical protein
VMTTEPPTHQTEAYLGCQPFHVCILGPSGIGKSPLASLFRLPGLDPLRVREPRDEKDKALCILESDAIDLYQRDAPSATPWPEPTAAPDWFVLGAHWLFMSVRGDRQCLRFAEDDGTPVLRSRQRIEVFGPRLLDILQDRDGCQSRIGLTPDNVVILLLNPSAQSYDKMSGSPDDDLKQATFYAINKRTELQGKTVDVPDSQKRVRRLPDELVAWVDLKHLVGQSCVEYTAWPHFEFRYHQPEQGVEIARRELLSARDTILAGLYAAQSNPVIKSMLSSDVIRTSAEIVELTDIV